MLTCGVAGRHELFGAPCKLNRELREQLAWRPTIPTACASYLQMALRRVRRRLSRLRLRRSRHGVMREGSPGAAGVARRGCELALRRGMQRPRCYGGSRFESAAHHGKAYCGVFFARHALTAFASSMEGARSIKAHEGRSAGALPPSVAEWRQIEGAGR
jgi:hypothetical protein